MDSQLHIPKKRYAKVVKDETFQATVSIIPLQKKERCKIMKFIRRNYLKILERYVKYSYSTEWSRSICCRTVSVFVERI
jgi:hypothetical protein